VKALEVKGSYLAVKGPKLELEGSYLAVKAPKLEL
jgi:hypothetical protein